ncbi:MAG: collagen binding domain-containing protein [Oscillospiraceae bacterium]
MKNGFWRRILALILVCTMLAGQVMVNVVYATDADDIPIISDDGNNTIDFSKDGVSDGEDGTQEDTPVYYTPAPLVLPDSSANYLSDGNGGLSVTVKVSPENGVLQDGQKCSFTVVIRDDDLDTPPNITAGDILTITMPQFMKPEDEKGWLNNCDAYFENPVYSDDENGNHVLQLTFKEFSGSNLYISLKFSMVIDTIGYDGDGQGSIEIKIGDTVKDDSKGSTDGDITIDDGTGSGDGSGEGEGETEPKLYKRIWSNSKESDDGSLVIRDPKEPIGYSVSFNATLKAGQPATLTDNLSNGNLVLCDSAGNINASLSDVFTIVVGGATLTGGTLKDSSLVFEGTRLGKITIEKTENGGFTMACQNTTGADVGPVSVVVKYYAKAGENDYFNNKVELAIDGVGEYSSSSLIRKYDNAALYATKSVGRDGAEVIYIDKGTTEVTFCITLTQYGVGDIYVLGDEITFDVLENCFVFDADKVDNEHEDLFGIKVENNEDDKQVIYIVKNGEDPIPAGTYNIYFTVTIDPEKWEYGESAKNTVGNTVFIRRKAKLTINKEWLNKEDGTSAEKGNGAKFELLTYDGVQIAETGWSTGDEFTLRFHADELAEGENICRLIEYVAENGEYMAAKEMEVIIKYDKKTDKVTIVSIDGVPYNSGSAEVTVQNEPDSGKGSLTFKKYSGSAEESNLLDGGTYELYRVVEGETDELVDTFSTANGVYVKTDLKYGTYYVKEISAPLGYVIEGDTTDRITLSKTAPHGTVSLVNKRFEDGKIIIKKVDENDQPLSGVEFTLTAGGNSETKTTGADGTVTFSGLTAGDYTITEKLPYGYSGFSGPIVVTIDEKGEAKVINAAQGATAIGNEITINWVNTQQFGSIKIFKTGLNNAVLAGAEFALYDGQGNEVRRGTTGNDGVLEFTGLAYGEYILKETKAPAGYVVSQELTDGVSVKIESTGTVERNYKNDTQKGSIKITKVDAEQNDVKLSGATFGLYSSADCNNESLIDSKITGENGTCTFDNLEAGTYYVKEISAPKGYQLNNEVFTFNLGTGENALWSLDRTVENSKRLYNLQLVKTNENGSLNLAGAQFTLSGTDLCGNKINKTSGVSGPDGIVKFSDLPFGNYTVTEIKAPDGYALAKSFYVEINEKNTYVDYEYGQTVEYGKVYDSRTKLTVLKVDDHDESVGLPGTTFLIKADGKYVTAAGGNGVYSYTGLVSSEEDATRFVTADAGIFTLEYLPMGSYKLIEVGAPDGYVISTEETTFAISKTEQSVSVGNTKIKAKLNVVKTDEFGKLLPGVGFTLNTAGGYVTAEGKNGVYTFTGYSDEMGESTVLITGVDGSLSIDGLLWGIYTLDEVSGTPEGLTPVTGITFEVVADNPSGDFTLSVKHGETLEVSVVNFRKVGEISFKKVDSSGDPLSGAVFKLELVEGNGYSETEPRYAVSDKNGTVTFKNVPYGTYKITEYLAPYGKTLSTEERTVTVDGTLKVYELADWVNNDNKISVVFKKAGTDGTALTGAVFQILDENKNVVVDALAINSTEGERVELSVGTYYLKEIKAPANYVLNTELIPFSVTEGGSSPVEVVMKNKPVTGSLTIVKSEETTEKPLSGAEFKVYSRSDYENGAENAVALYTVTTNSDGTVTIKDIPFGDYVVVETAAPKGYELSPVPQYFSISESDETVSGEVTLEFVNEKSRYVLEISKVDIESGESLSGAKFAVSSSNFYKEVEVGADGKITVEVPAEGIYYVTEIAAPEGYTIDPDTYMVEVNGHTPSGAEIKAQFVSQDYPTQIRILKVDENNEALGGALFQIFHVTENGEELMTFEANGDGSYQYSTDSNNADIAAGDVLVKGLPEGSYVLRETKAPGGYMILGDIAFTVSPSSYNRAITLTAQNLPYQRGVAVCKENGSGVRLAGAVFTLYDENGNELQSVTTGASGYVVFNDLGSGSYYIVETAAPEGYQKIDTRFNFQIDENGELQSEHAFVNYGRGEDPFYVITLTNTPTEQQFRIKKVSSASGGSLEGAQFRILGSGVNKVYTTGKDGLTDVISLPVGEYMLTEVKAPNGYAADPGSRYLVVRADGIELDGEALTGDFPVITFENEPESFRFSILKQDSTGRQPLSGAIFTVTGEDGSKVTLATGADGCTDVISLKPGKYAVTETKAPDGYNVPLTGWSFTVAEGTLAVTNVTGGADYDYADGVLLLTLTNERTEGSLLIYKHDSSDGNKALAGAQFQVLNEDNEPVFFTVKNGIYYVSDSNASGAGNVLTTNEVGQALLEGLPFGEYTVYEVLAPEGYELYAKGIEVKLTKQDETLKVDVADEQLVRKVKVFKQSAGETPEYLIGAVFALYRRSENEAPVFISEVTTGYDGKAEFTVPYGDYTIVETRAPEGYELSQTQIWEFSYNDETPDDYEFTYTFSNEKTVYDLEIYKYDSEQKDKGLAGAEFAVTNSRGYTITVKSDENGIARLNDIDYDDYTIREITAPEGYYLNDQVFTVTKDELVHGKAVRIEVPDTMIIGSVLLRKVDFENHDKILNAEFTVSDSSGNLLLWKKTEDGYLLSDEGESVISAGEVKLTGLPAGDYTINEVKAPDGYVILDESRTFSVNAGTAPALIEIEIENLLRKVAVGIIKMDSEDRTKRLAGAEFTLYPVENGTVGSALTTAVTNENGLAVFTDLAMGNYRIVETKAPYGFKLLSNPIDFVVDAEGKVLVGNDRTELPEKDKINMFGIVNTSVLQDLEIKKVSSETGKALAGATFTVTGNGMSWRVTTGKDGTAMLSLPYGEYVLKELIAPNGYIMDSSRHIIEVSENGITIDGVKLRKFTYVIENTPVSVAVSLHKQDSSSAKALSGAEFTISGNGRTYTLKTNASGNTDTIYLRPGQYAISETKAPNGYKIPISGWKLTISEDGRVSVEGEGATVALNSVSVTVTVENTKPGGGTGGSDIGKTGQINNSGLLLSGASLVLLSFTGLLALLIDEYRRHGKRDALG